MANSIPHGTETALDRFHLPGDVSGRATKVRDVLPRIDGENYCVLISELDLRVDGNFCKIDSFDDLFSICDLRRSADNLQAIRKNRAPTEATKCLSSSVADALVDAARGGRWLNVRCRDDEDEFLWQVDARDFLLSSDLLKYLPHPIGEYEIADEAATWYMRVRDDDPFLFLAASTVLVDRLDSECGKFALRVPGDFQYAA